MTNQLPRTYRPRFITGMGDEYHGDLLVRRALLEHMRAAGEDGVLRTALEHSMFWGDLTEALVPTVWDPTSNAVSNSDSVEGYAETVVSAVTRHPGFPSGYANMYLLSKADWARVITVVKAMTIEELDELWDEESAESAKLLGALSETVTIDVYHDSLLATLVQGGALNMPETRLVYDKSTGQFVVTRNSLKDYGLYIPRHPAYVDDNTPVLSIQYPKPADGVRIVVTSTRDDVPDAENPGQNKSEQHTVRLEKGDNIMALTLTGHDMKYHEWTFTVTEETETAKAEA